MQAVSLGAQLDVRAVRSGTVHSVFRGAVNLLVDDELWTVVVAGGHDGPFTMRVAVDKGHDGFGVRVADRVQVRGGFVGMGQRVLDCRAAPRWTPLPWAVPAAGLDLRLAAVDQAARARAWTGCGSLVTGLCTALRSSGSAADAQLMSAVRRTVGRGPGLTPAGDDVLVGLFTTLFCGGGVAGRSVASRLARALAPALHSTTDISRHLLAQAARGLPGRALHELGKALCEDAPHDELQAALARVLGTGATSGADASLGLLGAFQLLLPAERIAA